MVRDSFKQYIDLLHKKGVRKKILIDAGIIFGFLVFFFVAFSVLKTGLEEKLEHIDKQNNKRLETLMYHREQQVNQLKAGITQDHVRRWQIISVEKLIEYTQRNTPKKKRLKQEPRHKYATWIVDESTRHGLEITLVASVIAQESRFHSYAMSEMQAQGLMQVMDETGRWLSKELGIVYTEKLRFDPQTNIKMGTYYLKYLMDKRYDGSMIRALGHYNGGSYQSRAFVLRPKYKNHAEYKRPKEEVDKEYRELRERVKNKEDLTSEEKSRYKLLGNIRCAQNLVSETEHYIPEILERQKVFEQIMEDPTSLILGAEVNIEVDTTESE